MDNEQQVTLKLINQILDKVFYVTMVYAKCDANLRLQIWEDIYQMAHNIDKPWIIGGTSM